MQGGLGEVAAKRLEKLEADMGKVLALLEGMATGGEKQVKEEEEEEEADLKPA